MTRSEFDHSLERLNNDKSTDPDEIPVEVYKKFPQLTDELFEFVEFVWNQEVLPTNMTIARFVILYKHKGSANDPSKYRCIGLLNDSYKVLTKIMLTRLLNCSENFLKD